MKRNKSPGEVVDKALAVGLMHIGVPEAYGGQGLDRVAAALAAAEPA